MFGYSTRMKFNSESLKAAPNKHPPNKHQVSHARCHVFSIPIPLPLPNVDGRVACTRRWVWEKKDALFFHLDQGTVAGLVFDQDQFA